ncbi:hypothetical protein VE03_02098 [Pseudogymnoascus sp. 23342-1-I1]|nr:hypothetical protein VE03_02098 [Pseudogymnoascus sp. 23342-1-I1]
MERDVGQSTANIASNHAQPVSPVSEHSTTTQQGRQITELEMEGKPSVIRAYCRRHVADCDDKEAIWFCMQRGLNWGVAKDVHSTSVSKKFGIDELRKYNGWWKRHSMFSAVGVKEVKMRFTSFDKALNEIQVVIMDFDYDSITRDLNHYIQREVEKGVHIDGDSAVDIMGIFNHPDGCHNEGYDEFGGDMYCIDEHIMELRQRKENAEWLPSMLEFYWQNGIDDKGLKFLKSNDFVVAYRSLQYDRFTDAANPYGRTINAFKVIEGWHPRYMLCLFAGSTFCSLCIVALVTTINGSFEIGFTAGSYALALATMIFAY